VNLKITLVIFKLIEDLESTNIEFVFVTLQFFFSSFTGSCDCSNKTIEVIMAYQESFLNF